MRLLSGSILLLAAITAVAQTTPAPQLTARGASTAPDSAQAANPSPYTIKASAQRVLVDVVVKDKHGNIVHGLKQGDFSVFENGQPEVIRSFDEHASTPGATAADQQKFPTLPPGQFTNFVPVKQNSALTVVLFDRLNTGQRDQQYVLDQLKDYLKHEPANSRTAIYGLSQRLSLLQGFTSDPKLLLAALDHKALPQASPLRDDTVGGGAGVEDLSALTGVFARDTEFAAAQAAVQGFQAQYQSFQSQLQGKYTLDAFNALARSLSGVPGRKNLIWFAGNFPNGFFPGDNDDTTPFAQFAGLDAEYQETIDLLTAAQIAIYPVDAQGLRTNNVNNAALANNGYAISRSQSPSGLGAANDLASEEAATAQEHLGMDDIAHNTGGQAFYNHNDLNRAIADAVNDGSNYYTLSYAPSNADDKKDLRHIAVKINGQDYKLSYRRSYYLDPHESKKGSHSGLQLASAAPQTPSSLKGALLYGGPEPDQILLRVRAAPLDNGGDPTVVQGNQANPDEKKSKGPYQAFQVDYATSIRNVSMRKTADGLIHADVDFIVYVYNSDGVLVNAQSNTFRGTYTQTQLAEELRTGLPFTQKISVPDAGNYTLRMAVRDNIGDKVGAVEVPVSAIKHLPLLSLSTPTAASTQPVHP